MGKSKDKKKGESASLQKTAKFSVIDAPGVTQPDLSPPVAETVPSSSSSASVPVASGGGKQGRRAIVSDGPRMGESLGCIGGDSFPGRRQNVEWLKERLAVFEEVSALRKQEFSTKDKTVPIAVTLPNGTVLEAAKDGTAFTAWTTTPYNVAATVSQGLADASTVARVTYGSFVDDYDPAEDGMPLGSDSGEDPFMGDAVEEDEKKDSDKDMTFLWDMNRPLVGPVSRIEFLKFDDDDPAAKTVFWHSSAHVLGEAMERLWGARLTIGPPLAGGFYYDSYMGSEDPIREEDYKAVEQEVSKIAKEKQTFERLVVTKDEALRMFKGNPFKEAILTTKVADGTRTTVYRCGELIDLCRGPHLPHTGRVKAFAATRHSATNWLGDTKKDSLQRLYGISFPDKKQLKVWKENQEKAKERDHRRIAQKQHLIMFHDLSPGSAFWLPHGARIYNNLIGFIKEHYWKRGYNEVITPNVFNLQLWNTSGHAQHYKENMFCFDVEGQEWAMKPMNCPAHCLIYKSFLRSWRDLPLRYADFGVLHRNELSGALTGLTRVRRFQQDDAHIFCTEDQIESEVAGVLDFVKSVYNTFGMSFKLELSTRPEKALGDVEIWAKAEQALANAMNTFAGEGNWRVNPGDGAFYGPKIDIKVMDAMQRIHQCATVQLDFQLPIRFDLTYSAPTASGDGKNTNATARPVMIHRAMLGSVERMFAVLCEHYGGKWPLWLSPRQVMLVPVHADWVEYCKGVQQKLHDEGFYVDLDDSRNTFQKKVRSAQVAQYNYQLVVGEQEVTNGTVNIRTRDNVVQGEQKVEDMIAMLKELRADYK